MCIQESKNLSVNQYYGNFINSQLTDQWVDLIRSYISKWIKIRIIRSYMSKWVKLEN